MSNTFSNLKALEKRIRQGTPKYNFNARLDIEKIEIFEKAYGIVLSESYKQFLEMHNGGMITRYKSTSYIDMTEFEADHPTRDSYMMFGYDDVIDNYTNLKSDNWMMPKGFHGNYPIIPICKMPESEGKYLFLFSEKGIDGESPIFAFLGESDNESCFKVADNFNDFLGLLMEHEGFPPILKTNRKKTCHHFMEQSNIITIASADETDNEVIERNSAYIQLSPKSAWSYNERGISYRDLGQRQLALEDFNKSIEINNEQAFFYYCRGDLILDYGSPRKALIDFDIAVKLDPSNKLFLSGRADALQKLGKLSKSLADCNKVLDEDSKYTLALYVRERVYKAMGEDELAQVDSDLIDELK